MRIVKAKLKHIEHVEDLMFDDPVAGATRSIDVLFQVLDGITGSGADSPLITNVKVDGSPSLVFGPIPTAEPNAGEFFVGTKSALSPTGKRYTKHNIADLDIENEPEKAAKLREAFRALSNLNVTKIYQGDLLFTPSAPPTQRYSLYSFTPNVITYTVNPESKYYAPMQQAEVGIVVHTVYDGSSFAEMYATYDVDQTALPQHPSVLLINNRVNLRDAFYIDPSAFERAESTLAWATGVNGRITPAFVEWLKGSPGVRQLMKRHVNYMIRGNQPFGDTNEHMYAFERYIINHYATELTKVVTERSKARLQQDRDNIITALASYGVDVMRWFTVYHTLVEVKQTILDGLCSIDGVESWFEEGDNQPYKTSGEGLVIANATTNEVIKFVDRYEFSRINFSKVRDWMK